MRYFEDALFAWGGHIPQCDVVVAQRFPDFHALQFCAEGRMFFSRDPNPREEPSCPFVFWTTPEHFYRYGAIDAQGWDHHWIAVRGPRVERWFDEGIRDLSERDWIAVGRVEPYRRLFREVISRIKERHAQCQAECIVLVEEILMHLARDKQSGAGLSPRGSDIMELAGAIRLNPQLDRDFREDAKALGLAYHSFREVFKNVVGSPPKAWLLDSALAGVARCLSESKPRIKEVAVKFGFNSPGHLSRMFRRAYGLSPRDFANGVHRR